MNYFQPNTKWVRGTLERCSVGSCLKGSLSPVGTFLKRSLSPVGTSSILGICKKPRMKTRIMDAIWMLGFIVFFRVNGGSVAEKSWFARATVLGVAALESLPVRFARAAELMVQGDTFSSLMMLCYRVLHVLKHFVHWNCCIEEMRSLLELLEFEGCLARKLRFQLFNSWNSKDASHESVVFTSSTLGIRRMPRTKASFSTLQLLEFEGCLARKLRFHIFSSWNSKDA